MPTSDNNSLDRIILSLFSYFQQNLSQSLSQCSMYQNFFGRKYKN